MDYSERYIKMCKDAIEIQNKWEHEHGDIYLHEAHTISKLLMIDVNGNDYGDYDCACCEGKRFWLPRQDQLQNMLYVLPTDKRYNQKDLYDIGFVACPNVICKELIEFSESDCEMGMETMEQLWLAFVMKEKFNRIWSENKWNLKS